MPTVYPVHLDVTPPAHHERLQVVLRILLAIVLGWVGVTAGWLVCVLYGFLPLIAAITIPSLDGKSYATEVGPRLWKVLAWLLELSAFMSMVVDQFPNGDKHLLQIEIKFTGTPTVKSALTRLVTSIPSGLVLMLLWCVSGLLWFVDVIVVLFGRPMPDGIIAFQRGVLRWQARLVAYHASLVDEYPPFAFETHHGRGAPLAASGGAR